MHNVSCHVINVYNSETKLHGIHMHASRPSECMLFVIFCTEE